MGFGVQAFKLDDGNNNRIKVFCVTLLPSNLSKTNCLQIKQLKERLCKSKQGCILINNVYGYVMKKIFKQS